LGLFLDDEAEKEKVRSLTGEKIDVDLFRKVFDVVLLEKDEYRKARFHAFLEAQGQGQVRGLAKCQGKKSITNTNEGRSMREKR
jgi:hypothetical protein